MVIFDSIGAFFANHIHSILDTAVWNYRHYRGVNHTKLLDAMYPKLWIDDTLLDALGQTSSSARVERRLTAVKNSSLHQLVIFQRHFPRVLPNNNVLETIPLGEDIIAEPYTLAHSHNVEVICKNI